MEPSLTYAASCTVSTSLAVPELVVLTSEALHGTILFIFSDKGVEST